MTALAARGRHHRPSRTRAAVRRLALAVWRAPHHTAHAAAHAVTILLRWQWQWPLWLLDLPWRLRTYRERRRAEAAKDEAYARDLHEMNTDRYMPAWRPAGFNAYAPAQLPEPFPPAVTAAGPPPAAVLADQDVPGLEHLGEGQYSDDTHAFSRYVDGGQE
jgi:hypothetical protein